MSDLIYRKNGEPFQGYTPAKTQQTYLKRTGVMTEIVKVEGGYALRNVVAEPTIIQQEEKPEPMPVKEIVEEETRTIEPRKRDRVPLGRRNILKYPDRPGFKRRVVNDIDDRVKAFEEAGWKVVQQGDLNGEDHRAGAATRMGMSARKPVGGGVHGVLMEIPKDWYNEDQKAKQDELKRLEDDMRRTRDGMDGTYGEISIR